MAEDCKELTELKLAFSLLKGTDAELLRAMESLGVDLHDFFAFDVKRLSDALGHNVNAIFSENTRGEALSRAREEHAFMQKHQVRALFIGDDDYPWRLIDTNTPPLLLYCLGNSDLNAPHAVSVVGTRKPSPYGVASAENIVSDLAGYFPDLNVISGLAYGIDSVAHKTALEGKVATTAVVAHGLDMIYPSQNRDLARRIVCSGGSIISEYPTGTRPFPAHFLERNRIVACIPDVTIVIESDMRGGAMSTANTAFSYSRDVMAVPGRISDQLSRGCNHIIRKNKAQIITCAADLIEVTGWEVMGTRLDGRQRNLFPELQGDEHTVYETLRHKTEPCSLDSLHAETRLPMSQLMAALSELEFNGVIIRHPGNRYSAAR